jgi:DNA-binding helix-hairpin-helix protein with protein kinase domain
MSKQYVNNGIVSDEKQDLQRCNHCCSVFDEALTSCPTCHREDALMFPYTTLPSDQRVTQDGKPI